MNEDEIKWLERRVKQGQVFYLDVNGRVHLVLRVDMNWIEFPDQPQLSEPAAILRGPMRTVAALQNVELRDFMVMRALSGEYDALVER